MKSNKIINTTPNSWTNTSPRLTTLRTNDAEILHTKQFKLLDIKAPPAGRKRALEKMIYFITLPY